MLGSHLFKSLSLASGVTFLCGCASVCTSIPSDNMKSAKIGTSFFNKAQISDPNSTTLNNGFVQAASTISNLSSDSQTVQYRFVWFDDAGMPIENDMPWTPLQLYPDLSKTVTAISPNKNTTKFHVEACMLKPTNDLVSFYRD